jgi:hypothetical protein
VEHLHQILGTLDHRELAVLTWDPNDEEVDARPDPGQLVLDADPGHVFGGPRCHVFQPAAIGDCYYIVNLDHGVLSAAGF